MAAAAVSPLASSEEKTNGAKLSRLLIDGGTTVLRNVFNAYHPPANLAADLNACFSILNNLLRRRILNRHQWNILFPASGVAPDSNTFDITLLFLLLTNICGLSPPPTGWHSKPPPSDTSLEANLARVKFFRNELYGHVSTTGVDTPTFSALWQEISAVLVALGLSQAEIDRLKAERCGEEDYIDVLRDWVQSEEEIKSQLKDVLQSQATTQQTVEENKSKLEEVHQVVTEIRQNQLNTEQEDEILNKLAKVNTQNDIKCYREKYLEGTRESIFVKVKSWLDDRSSPNRVLVISGNAAMGKSVIAAVLCKRMQEAGRLSGSHFCQHDKARHRNPKVMLQSLAYHLTCCLPEYKKALAKQLSRNLGLEINDMEVGDLFELLFEEPLSQLSDPGFTSVVVVDALDESEYQGRNELLDVIAKYFVRLPRWIRFFLTTRPELNIWDSLKSLHPLLLEPNDEENLADSRLYFEQQLRDVLQAGNHELILRELVQKSEGVILCAQCLVDFIKTNFLILTLEQVHSTLPSGISSVYQSYFKRLETDLCKELKITEDQFFSFLSAISATREPLPLGFVSKLLFLGTSSSAVQRKVNKAIACISSLLPVQDDCVHFFHKSVKDWLVDKSSYGQHNFIVDENEGHKILSRLCIDECDDVKRKGVYRCQQFSYTTKYALQHGVQHMLELDEDSRSYSLGEILDKYALDLELVFAKLCTKVSEGIVCFKKQVDLKAFCARKQNALETLLFLLRKRRRVLKDLPHALFQILLNEGGPELSSEASNLLETKYPDVPYMEYLNKSDLHGAVQTEFYCSSKVACFDVSPKSDYMVCECCDGTIQLWSIQTGRLMWKRPVIEMKLYSPHGDAFRTSDPCAFLPGFYSLSPSQLCNVTLSYFRSVVFHPTEDVILPGVLSHAYAFDGGLIQLFPESKCSFYICSVSGDTMLTGCLDDSKCLIMWSLRNGREITRVTRDEDILSFAWSRDRRLLAISHSTGSVCLVDAMSNFRTLAETSTSHACGIIKFSADHRFLFCWHLPIRGRNEDHHLYCLDINMENLDSFALDVSCDSVSYEPWEFELRSEGGFLLGDPLCCLVGMSSGRLGVTEGSFTIVLNGQSVLRSTPKGDSIMMYSLDELTKSRDCRKILVRNLVFSVNGESVYVVTNEAGGERIAAWDVSSGEVKAEKRGASKICSSRGCCLVPVKEGLLFETISDTLELWNVELSECVRRWTDIRGITELIPITDERVVCRTQCQYVILDTTSGDKETMKRYYGKFVAFSSKCQLITTDDGLLRSTQTVLWEKRWPRLDSGALPFSLAGMFSPAEQFFVISGVLPGHGQGVYVLDALSGDALHILCGATYVYDCKFVSNEECVIHTYEPASGFLLQLYNVKSGDLLSVLEIDVDNRVYALASCPMKGLLAIGLMHSKLRFKVIQVKLPGKGKTAGTAKRGRVKLER